MISPPGYCSASIDPGDDGDENANRKDLVLVGHERDHAKHESGGSSGLPFWDGIGQGRGDVDGAMSLSGDRCCDR